MTVMTATCLCGQPARLKLKLKMDVYECGRCSLRFAVNARFNQACVSDLDETARMAALQEVRSANFDSILKRMRAMLPAGSTGLEIGSAYGWFMEKAVSAGYRCRGIEPEFDMWKHAVDRGLEVTKGFFPGDLPERTAAFDFLAFNDVLEHIPDAGAVLRECRRILRPGGLLIINIPLSSGIFYTVAEWFSRLGLASFANRMWQFDFHSPHVYYFNKQNLRACVEKHGFRLAHYDPMETLKPDSIRQRIEMDKKWSGAAVPLRLLLGIMYPVIRRLNEDVGCFYFEKRD